MELKENLVEDSRTTVKMEEMSATDAPANNAAIEDTAAVVGANATAPAMADGAKVSTASVMRIDKLMERLLSLLYRRDLMSAVEVCKRWNTIGEGPSLWKWVKLRVTGGNLTNMPVILGSRLAKVEEIILDIAISKEVLLAMEKHQGLNVLRVSECNVSDINSDLLARVITGIEEVSLEYTKLDEKQWNAVFNSTKGAKLKKLSIIVYSYGMDLSLANPQSLAEAASTLEKVKLDSCGLTTEQSKAMFDRLAVESKLKSIEIRCTYLSSVAVQSLAMVVSQVQEATLFHTHLTTQQITAIFNKATEEDSQLKVLNLIGNYLSQVNPHVMAAAVNKMDKVDLGFGHLNATQCNAIFGLAAGKSKLKDLDISDNDLSSVNKHDMERAVNNMEKINLECTELTNQQCIQIFKYAENESNLKDMKIGRNDLSAVEPGSMTRAVSKMEECGLQSSKLTNQQVEDIFKHINEDCKLKNLHMAGVNLSSVDGDVIATAVANLYQVNLGYTNLTTPQLEAVLMAIRSGRKLKVLRLCGVYLRSVQIESLVEKKWTVENILPVLMTQEPFCSLQESYVRGFNYVVITS